MYLLFDKKVGKFSYDLKYCIGIIMAKLPAAKVGYLKKKL